VVHALHRSVPGKPGLTVALRVGLSGRETRQIPGRVMVWGREDCGTFLDAAEDDRLYHLAAYFGLRRGLVRVPNSRAVFRAAALWSVHQRRTGGAGG